MANLKDIRNRISSIKNTKQITSAMKMVAAAKLRKAQQRMWDTRPYAKKLKETISNLASGEDQSNPFMEERDSVDRILLIIVSSDRGLCGGFNNNLFKVIDTHIKDELKSYKKNDALDLICIGRKSHEYYTKRGYNVIGNHVGFFDEIKFDKVGAIMKNVRAQFLDGTYDKVEVAFNEFKSVIAQNRIVDTLLPITTVNETEEGSEGANETQHSDYIYEPDAVTILNNIVPQYVNMRLWQAVLESNAAEQGARMAAMDNATENAKEMLDDLKLEYNQARQAAITTEISEIVSGAEALKEN